jgi:hypothetical protein
MTHVGMVIDHQQNIQIIAGSRGREAGGKALD